MVFLAELRNPIDPLHLSNGQITTTFSNLLSSIFKNDCNKPLIVSLASLASNFLELLYALCTTWDGHIFGGRLTHIRSDKFI